MSAGIEDSPTASPRWGLCFTVIAALHIGGAWAALRWSPSEASVPPPQPVAVMLNLAPLPALKRTTSTNAQTKSQPALKRTSSQSRPKPVMPSAVQPIPPSTHHTDAALPLKPMVQPPEHVALQEQPKQRLSETSTPLTTTPQHAEAPPAPTATQPAQSAAAAVPPTNAVPTWQGLLLGRLERYKRYPDIAQLRHQEGVAYLRFSMDRHGKILSAEINKSSGFDALDA